ncbi:Major capsid protein GpE [uncultured Caudovirales phage]|uniref:Major capsid protein GpE n=1 Tax=uncultured Caudovirales phage TaxID=2100421 RepID=A0A6J5Q0M7_9CAUD|nr:Major capsid protein GpE [uncultured Caudovirales phage]
MPSNVKELLKWEGLTALYTEADYNLQTPLTDKFFTNPIQVDGDEYEILVDPNDTRPAPINRKDSAARNMDGVGLIDRRGVLLRTFNSQSFGQDVMSAIREPKSRELDRKGKAEILRQTARFRQRHALLKELLIARALTTGSVIYDRSTGNIVDTASGTTETIDLGVAAAHKGNLGGQVSVTLANVAFDLIGLLDYIDSTAIVENSEPITDVHCDISMKALIYKNTQFQAWAAKGNRDSESVLRGQFVEGLFGKNWHFYGASYTDSTGTKKKYIPSTVMAFTPPAESRTWYDPAEGSSLVPTSVEAKGSIEDAVNSLAEVYGPHSYSQATLNPVRVDHYAGDCFGWNYKAPQSVFMPTVVF